MTTEERFERIETEMAGTTVILRRVAEFQERQALSLTQVTESISKYIDHADARINQMADDYDARMKRLEENLAALIRAITADHGNGKKH